MTISRIVDIPQIFIHNLCVVVALSPQVELYADIARDQPNTLPIIKLGRIKNKLYLLSHLDVFYGIKKSGLSVATAEIIDFENDYKFLIEHVKLNKSYSGYNSLLLHPVMKHLSKNGIPHVTALKLLHIKNTIEEELLGFGLNSNVVDELCLFYSYLAGKLSSCTIPFYIFERISKCEYSKQLQVAKKIIQFVKTETITDSKFAWPSIKSIDILLSKSENPIHDSAVMHESDDTPTKKDYAFAENFIKKSKHLLVIPKTENHPAYMINKKTNTVSVIDEKDNIITLVEMPTTLLYTLPKRVTNHLELDESVDVEIKCFKNNDAITKYLKKHSISKGVFLFK